ncbi:hypothetical protein IEO21_10364 [Rhodonia placenta]|uniref:Uncharacterized protein n=1 Tax=Rhodonia placenta TaxID=104341 RepID=A0A8H7NSK9_9APHY|nr:hypothetical protein IEO21_10364 [Postia placenta]
MRLSGQQTRPSTTTSVFLRQQDDRVLTKLIRLDNLKVAHRFQLLLPCNIRAQHNKFIPRAIPNATPDSIPFPPSHSAKHYHPGRLAAQPWLDTEGKLQTMWIVSTLGCGKEAPGHLEQECGSRPMKRHVSAPPEEPAQCVGVVVDNMFIEGIMNEAKEKQTKAVPVPPPSGTNPVPQTNPIAGPSRPRPDTPVVFRRVDPDWTPDTTPWTWDNPWPRQEHLSGEEWKDVGRNARGEWFNEDQDNGVDWELFGDGEHLHNGVHAHFVLGIVPLRLFLH